MPGSNDQTLELLRRALRGRVLSPMQPDYDSARAVWNSRYESRPAAIVQCASAADVMSAVRIAREEDLAITVKSGGHDYAGHSAAAGGLLLDLSPMTAVRVLPETKRAWAQPAIRWGALDRETQAFGLATTGPTVSSVGLAGCVLGGGSGHLARRYGLTLDQLCSADVVTADGRLLYASEEENPDLFWALRGGGGNFGILTGCELTLHPVGPEVLAGQIVYPLGDSLDQGRDVLLGYREFMARASDDIQCYAAFLRVPALPEIAETHHGSVAIFLVAFHADPSKGEELAPLGSLGQPLFEAVGPMSYLESQQMFDPGVPSGQRWDSKAHYLPALEDSTLDLVLERVRELPGALSMAYFEPLGGATGRVTTEATAFPHREAAYGFHVLAGWSDPSEDEGITSWTRSVRDALASEASGVYVNLLGDDETHRIPAAYGPNYGRLRELKRKFDPENVFRANRNIEP